MSTRKFFVVLVATVFLIGPLAPMVGALSLEDAMTAVNEAGSATEVRTILTDLAPAGWSGLTNSAKNYSSDAVLASRPYLETSVFAQTVATAVSMEGTNAVIYDLGTGSAYLEEDIENTVTAIDGLDPEGWGALAQYLKEAIVLALAANAGDYYVNLAVFADDLQAMIDDCTAWLTAMAAVNAAGAQGDVLDALDDLEPTSWWGLSSSGRGYASGHVFARRPYDPLAAFQAYVAAAIATEAVNDVIYDLVQEDDYYLELDIENSVLALTELTLRAGMVAAVGRK